MNERIRELEKQCWDHQTNHLNSEKFAELIIKECMRIADQSATGISLRDYLAAKAMQTKTFSVRPYDDTKEIARDAYRMADAMLAAREK